MTDHTTTQAQREQFVTDMTERMASLARTLVNWVTSEPRTLGQIEQLLVRTSKDLGAALLAGLCHLTVPTYPAASLPCACGATALYQRLRPATVKTVLDTITFSRPYYLCPSCHHGFSPLDQQLQFCAGSRSAALDELLALLGATQDSFVQAAQVLHRLTLVHVCANSVRDATEQLGAVLLAQPPQPLTEPSSAPECPSSTRRPTQLYISMDGVLVHLHQRGWSEIKVGCCYQTRSCLDRSRPEQLDIRAHSASYVSALEQAQSFGWRLWQEALRRGALTADELVLLGDGAHWIWALGQAHFARATQILDWYHASEYVWNAASAIWGEASAERCDWAQAQLDKLWESKVAEVLVELERWRERGGAVLAALSYYTEHQSRMDYASYRARGLQIGSGSVESACKQLVTARLKQAGMIWNAEGAEAVGMVRAWLKSERWEEAMALRGVRTRSYRRKQAAQEGERGKEAGQAEQTQARVPLKPQAKARQELSAEMLAQVRAELAEQRGKSVWRRSSNLQAQAERTAQTTQPRPVIAA